MKKNKTIEDMLLNHSTGLTGLNYKTNYPMEKVNSKLFSKYWSTIMTNNHSKRSVKSGSKSRSSASKDGKDYNRLVTKSKLRLSGKLPTTKTTEIRVRQLEESNMYLTRENEMLVKENLKLKDQLNAYSNYCRDFSIDNIQYMLQQLPKLGKWTEELEEAFSTVTQDLIKERESCQRVFEEYTILTREKEKDIMTAEMNK